MTKKNITYPKEYQKWLLKTHKVNSYEQRKFYESASAKMKYDFDNSVFWADFSKKLKDFNDQYYEEYNYHLLMHRDSVPKILIKPFESFLEKTYRKNVLNNKNWPDEPDGGWLIPFEWYTKINDILRTCIVVKYLDGIQFLIEKINTLAASCEVECNCDLEARIDGYYAAHFNLTFPIEIPIGMEIKRIDVPIEIQITTQLQENIKRLLHEHYTKKRKLSSDGNDWLWDYSSDEFLANNLGHILHYVEGMIMEVRERQR